MTSLPVVPTVHRLGFAAAILGSITLAFGPWLVRIADVAPSASAFWRLSLAVIPLTLLARFAGPPLAAAAIDRRVLLLAACAGAFFAGDLALWHYGIKRTTLANASLLSNAASFLLPLWGFLMLGERPGSRAKLAILAAAAGTALLVGRSAELSERNLAGDLFCLASAVFYTGYLIIIDRLRGRVPVFPLLALSTLFGALILLPTSLAIAGSAGFWPHDWTPLLVLALSSQVIGQGLIVYAVGHLKPLVVGLALLVQPTVAAIIGLLRFGETPGLAELAGAALVVTALVLVRLPERRRNSAAPIP
jgi:drug/metabolite transporter (DMT)-like permease